MKIKLYTVSHNAHVTDGGDIIFATEWQARWYGRRVFRTGTYTHDQEYKSGNLLSHVVLAGSKVVTFFTGFWAIYCARKNESLWL